jgi:RimJ/RimL family protein N-acetyltransferase
MTAPIDTPALSTARLRLRRYREADRERFIALMGDSEVNRYVGDGALDREEASALFDRVFPVYDERRFAVWAVERADTGRAVGHAELKPRAGELGLELIYLLGRDSWGQGFGAELARALRDHALATLRVQRVIATIDPRNEPSRRILSGLGFRFVREWQEPEDDAITALWALSALAPDPRSGAGA